VYDPPLGFSLSWSDDLTFADGVDLMGFAVAAASVVVPALMAAAKGSQRRPVVSA
jgi:hypothetical protein